MPPEPPSTGVSKIGPGLDDAEAAERRRSLGANVVPERRPRPAMALLRKFWGPIPWMLEATILLQLLLDRTEEAAIIGILLAVNAVLSFAQESRADAAIRLLRKRLAVRARVLRGGQWRSLPAEEVVPGDVVHLRMGDIVCADVRLSDGGLELDQSSLTGESLPVAAGPGAFAYAGATVTRGEATGEVAATGAATYFGRTAELVRTAAAPSHLEHTIFAIVRYLAVLDAVLVAALLGYAWAAHMPFGEIVPFAVILLVASVPVALPATFTLATALGAHELARQGVLVTRLSAIEEAAGMDVLCTDKTGTITENRLSLDALRPAPGRSDEELLRAAALASDAATQDPIDLAILTAADQRNVLAGLPPRAAFVPFDPATKRSEAVVEDAGGRTRIVKGAPAAIAALLGGPAPWAGNVERLAADGHRVMAVAAGTGDALEPVGLLGIADPPRPDSAELVRGLKALGLRVVLVSGDSSATARAVADRVGIGRRTCSLEALRAGKARDIAECQAVGGVLPEDKYRLVRSLQRAGGIVGMTGDGVNDAPALRQAEIGIAVAGSTDVARSAAGIVLTSPGLIDILTAIRISRGIYQRMLTYTLNKIIKTFQVAIFLSLGVMLTGVFVITPLLIVLLLFTNDFVTMAIATDHVGVPLAPERWHVRRLMLTGAALAAPILVLSFALLVAGRDLLHLPLAQLQTLIFVMLVATGQGTVYLIRERGHFWRSRPSRWLLASSLADLAVVGLMASLGILMAPIAPTLILALLAIVACFLAALDFGKAAILRKLRVS
ncbi:MAG: plasma-membrane proton-efflux P-type ATPase [Magnetospirillum sp.]|nr:plasma-membrane proton-efflux P-type ATPase [Magnetospirillum sp.]